MAGQNISHEGHRQRMRTRVEQYGLESLAPHEVLEYLLYITNARRDTNGIAHARLLAQKSCHVCVPGGLLRPRTEAIIGAAAITALQQFNFTKAFIGANGVALNIGFTTPDPEEAAVKAVAVRRARETWYLVDDSKFGRVYPAVIGEIYSGAILTNRCPDPKYRQLTLVKETEQ